MSCQDLFSKNTLAVSCLACIESVSFGSWTSCTRSLTSKFHLLFRSLYESYSQSQESKIRCIMHYFERLCSCLPIGTVSFERKILPVEYHNSSTTAPDADFWSKSDLSLCAFKVTGIKLWISVPCTTKSANACTLFLPTTYIVTGSLFWVNRRST